MKKQFYLLTLSLALAWSPLFAAHYTIDPNHSQVTFKIRHMGISKVGGKFDKFSGDFDYEEGKPKTWKAQAVIEAASIDTGVEKRDNHLKSSDFFDVEKYSTLTFKSTEVQDLGKGKAKLSGLLNMHGVEKPVTLDLEIGGVVPDMGGKGTRAGFAATVVVSRKDFGMTTGAPMVGDDVEIAISVEGVSENPNAPADKKMEQQNKMEKKPMEKK